MSARRNVGKDLVEGEYHKEALEFIYDAVKQKDGSIKPKTFIKELETRGILHDDPRMTHFFKSVNKHETRMTKEDLMTCISKHVILIESAFTNSNIIGQFKEFSSIIQDIYYSCVDNKDGKVSNYIAQYARRDPEYNALSVCTINGQRLNIGDTGIDFCVHSCIMPISYCMALEEHGHKTVHKYVGKEPKTDQLDALEVNNLGLPHNPFIISGAIMICALIKNTFHPADRFDYTLQNWSDLAAGMSMGYSNSAYLSEKLMGDRHYALAYYMKQMNVFSPNVDVNDISNVDINDILNVDINDISNVDINDISDVYLDDISNDDINDISNVDINDIKNVDIDDISNVDVNDILEFYFQIQSLTTNTNLLSIVAASLANGGVCPLTRKRIFTHKTVKCCLSLMYTCGMYNDSGEFAFNIGLPGKSGNSGAIFVVIPNVMGICTFSPRLDKNNNSVRGLDFFRKFIQKFNFHLFDSIACRADTEDLRRKVGDLSIEKINRITSKGDLGILKRLRLSGNVIMCGDYDKRTPLHIAASYGYLDIIVYFLELFGLDIVNCVDRWHGTPLDDALREEQAEVIEYLILAGAVKGCDL